MRFLSSGSAKGYYSYNFLNLMSYSKFIFKCNPPPSPTTRPSPSPYRAPVLLAFATPPCTNCINKWIYNADSGGFLAEMGGAAAE